MVDTHSDMLQKVLLLEQSVQCIVSVTSPTYSARYGEGVDVAVIDPLLIDETNGELHSTVLKSGDQLASSTALPGNVEINELTLIVLHV